MLTWLDKLDAVAALAAITVAISLFKKDEGVQDDEDQLITNQMLIDTLCDSDAVGKIDLINDVNCREGVGEHKVTVAMLQEMAKENAFLSSQRGRN